MRLSSLPNAFVEIRFPRLWMPMAIYLPLGAALTAGSLYFQPRPLSRVLLFFAVGFFSWSLIEYFLHRFMFHHSGGKSWRSVTAAFHISHHEAVLDHGADLVITRPAGSLPFAIVFYFIFALLSQSFSIAALVMTGAFLGYLGYECVHYTVHHFQPKSRLGAYLRRYHLQHHLRFPNRRFGVTSPLWDWVFGTYR
jgi:Sterol desaturase